MKINAMTRGYARKKLAGFCLAASVILAARFSAGAVIYQNDFSGSEPGPSPSLTGTQLTETLKLGVGDNAWVGGLVQEWRASGNPGAVAPGTYIGWFKIPDTAVERQLFRIVGNAEQPTAASQNFSITQATPGSVNARKIGGESRTVASAQPFTPGVWCHVAIVFLEGDTGPGGAVRLYLNGMESSGQIWNDLITTSAQELWIGDTGTVVSQVTIEDRVLSAQEVLDHYWADKADFFTTLSGDALWSSLVWSGIGMPDWSQPVQIVRIDLADPSRLTMDVPVQVDVLGIQGEAPLTVAGTELLQANTTIFSVDADLTGGNLQLGTVQLNSGVTLTVTDLSPFQSLALGANQTLKVSNSKTITDLSPYYALFSGGWVALDTDVDLGSGSFSASASGQAIKFRIEEGVSVTAERLVLGLYSGASGEIVINGGSLTLTSEDKTFGINNGEGALFLGNWPVSPASVQLKSGSLSVENGAVNLGRDAAGAFLAVGTDEDPEKAATAFAKLYGVGTGYNSSNHNTTSIHARFVNGTVSLGVGGIHIPTFSTGKYIELAGPVTLTAHADWRAIESHPAGLRTTASGGNTPTIDNAGFTITLDAAVSGVGGLRFANSGSEGEIYLNGLNTYSGGTVIDGATVITSSATPFGSGGVSVGNAVLDIGTARSLASLSVTGETTLKLTLSAPDFAAENGVLLKNVSESSAGLLSVEAQDANGMIFETELVNGELLLIKQDTTLIWNGSFENDPWDVSQQNWLNNGLPSAFITGAHVIFGDSGSKSIPVAGHFLVGNMEIIAPGYTFSGEDAAIEALNLTQTADASILVPLTLPAINITAGAELTASTLTGIGEVPPVEARYLKLVLTGHNGATDGVAVAELLLFNGETPVVWPTGSAVELSPGSTTVTNANELPRSLIDGYYGSSTANTAWGGVTKNNKLWIRNPTAERYAAAQVYALVILTAPVTFTGYRICSSDHGPRNATGWVLLSSMDGENWRLFDRKTGLTAEANRVNTWYGDGIAADSSVPPSSPQSLSNRIAFTGGGNITADTVTGSVEKSGNGTLTLTGDNSATIPHLAITGGSAAFATQATLPKNLTIGENAAVETSYEGVLNLAWLEGGGTLSMLVNFEGGLIIPGTFAGTIRLLPGTQGNNPKIRFDQSTLPPSPFWFDVAAGAQLWANVTRTQNVRLAGEGGDGTGEKYGGALRTQSTSTQMNPILSGLIEVAADATITGNNRTCASSISPAAGLEAAPVLSLGVAVAAHTSVDGNLTFTGPFSGTEQTPLDVLVNAYEITFKGGFESDVNLRVAGRAVGRTAEVKATLTGDSPKVYNAASVTVGGGDAGKTESLIVTTNATLSVSGAITVTEADTVFRVEERGTLAYTTGSVEGVLTLNADSTLQPLAFTQPLSVGSLALPAEGTVALNVDESVMQTNGSRNYLIKTAAITSGRPLGEVFTGVPEEWLLGVDPTGIYLFKPGGLRIILY